MDTNKEYYRRSIWFVEFGLALAALAVAMALNYWTGRMADEMAWRARSSSDLLLTLLPVADTQQMFVWGFVGFVAWVSFVTMWWERAQAARVAWLYALLICVRCLFVLLTPLKQPEHAIYVGGNVFFDWIGRYVTFKNDLFFSAHAAFPYLGFLIFRGRFIRLSFLLLSVFLAVVVLLGRVHYSIDVFGAYFITYALYRADNRWLRRFYRQVRHRLFFGTVPA